MASINSRKRTRAILRTVGLETFVEASVRLTNEEGWDFFYWIGPPKMEKWVKEAFPNIIFHPSWDAIAGIWPKECALIDFPPLDEKLLAQLSHVESLALKMMDRHDSICAFSYEERVRHYHRQLQYWLGVVTHHKPEVVVFTTPPHLTYDFLLYHICHFKGIPTVILEMTPHPWPGLFISYCDLDSRYKSIEEKYRRLLLKDERERISIQPAAKEYLSKISSAYEEAIPYYFKTKLDAQNKRVSRPKRIAGKLLQPSKYPHHFAEILDRLRSLGLPGDPPVTKLKNRRIEEWPWRQFDQELYRIRATRYKTKLRRHYESTATSVDLSRPFVYVPLHYQPERSTSPDGGFYVHQKLIIDNLADSLPNDWRIYVKEHPSQFRPYSQGERSRSFELYDDLLKITNVRLVSLSVPSFSLIDNAKAVASVAGTAGWEAVARGIPALVFAKPWYGACDGILNVSTREDLPTAVSKLKEGFRPNPRKIEVFLEAFLQSVRNGYIKTPVPDNGPLTHEENINNIISALLESFNSSSDLSKDREPYLTVSSADNCEKRDARH